MEKLINDFKVEDSQVKNDDSDAEIQQGDEIISNQEQEAGVLIVWGCGEFGQHGHGHTEDVFCCDGLGCPLWLGQDRMVLNVACGSSHTLVLTDDNKVYSWGNGNSGQLGLGTTDSSPHPRTISLGMSSGTKLKGIACGTRHSFVWTQDGDCFSFGNNYSCQLGYDFRRPDFKDNQLRPIFVDTLLRQAVFQVACGARHSVFLFTTGKVAAVGTNNKGQIGCGDTIDSVFPKPVVDLSDISIIACGNSHSLAADVHGRVYVWGYSKACGSKVDVLLPQCVYSGIDAISVEDIAGGDSHCMLLLSNGVVFTWGNNFEGQLGLGKKVKFMMEPKEIESTSLPGRIVSISVGENTSAAVNADGKLYLWGKNSSQVIRKDENHRFFQYEPFHVPLGMWKASKVSCGSWHIACVVHPGQRNKTEHEFPPVAAISENLLHDSNEDRISSHNGDYVRGEQLDTDSSVDDVCSALDDIKLLNPSDEEAPNTLNIQKTSLNLSLDSTPAKNEVEEKPFVYTYKKEIFAVPDSDKIAHLNHVIQDEEAPSGTVDIKTCTIYSENVKWSNQQVITADPKGGEWSEEICGIQESSNSNSESVTDDKLKEEHILLKKAVDCEEKTEHSKIECSKKSHKESDFDIGSSDQRLNSKMSNSEGKKQSLEQKEEFASPTSSRQRSHSEHLVRLTDSSHKSPAFPSALQSSSLSDLSCHPQEGKGQGRRWSPAHVTPRTIDGHLNREKKPARMLRHSSVSGEYHLPNQVVHTVNVGVSQTTRVLIPHPPMHRTQSSPSLYSSNLLRSPLVRKKSTVSETPATRTLCPPGTVNSDIGLPPKPPVWNRPKRHPEGNIMFSSGSSWRKRK